MALPVYILNGPNLNLLGQREPGIYGQDSLADIEAKCRATAETMGLTVDFRQTNHEGTLVDWLHEANTAAMGVVLNAGAYTHTSVALQDAVRSITTPVVEVHLSNIASRESIRNHSFISPFAAGVVHGFGPRGYLLALEALRAQAADNAE